MEWYLFLYECIYNKSGKKTRPRGWAEAQLGSMAALTAHVLPWRPFFILLNYSSAPPLALSAVVVQLFNNWPTFTPGVVCEESVEQLLCYVLFGVCKIPPRSWKSKSSRRSPQSYQPVLEKWVLQVSGDRGVCRCWGRVGILQLQGRHPFLSWGFLKDMICCVALSLSQTLLLFRCPSHALSFLFSYLFFPLLLSSLHFSPLLFIISSLLCTSVFLLSLFFWPITIFRVDQVGLRDGLRCGICRKMNCSWIRCRTKTAVPANSRVRLCDRVQGCRRDICKSHSVITSFKQKPSVSLQESLWEPHTGSFGTRYVFCSI